MDFITSDLKIHSHLLTIFKENKIEYNANHNKLSIIPRQIIDIIRLCDFNIIISMTTNINLKFSCYWVLNNMEDLILFHVFHLPNAFLSKDLILYLKLNDIKITNDNFSIGYDYEILFHRGCPSGTQKYHQIL